MFLDPSEGGVDPEELGIALHGGDASLVQRIAGALPAEASRRFSSASATAVDPPRAAQARAAVLDRIFWPLAYWSYPDEIDQLLSAERLEPELISVLELDAKTICDIGAGAGRFTLQAAARAKHVIAVDAAPPMLERLQLHARELGYTNIECRRGSFRRLPVDDRSIDIAVACSSLQTTGPHGGEAALHEAERVVRPGGVVAIIWPQQPGWFEARGYARVSVPQTDCCVHFTDATAAEYLCSRYHVDGAAEWVRVHRSPDVPYKILRMRPPTLLCVKRIEYRVTDRRSS